MPEIRDDQNSRPCHNDDSRNSGSAKLVDTPKGAGGEGHQEEVTDVVHVAQSLNQSSYALFAWVMIGYRPDDLQYFTRKSSVTLMAAAHITFQASTQKAMM